MTFGDQVIDRARSLKHPLCVGLDPYLGPDSFVPFMQEAEKNERARGSTGWSSLGVTVAATPRVVFAGARPVSKAASELGEAFR